MIDPRTSGETIVGSKTWKSLEEGDRERDRQIGRRNELVKGCVLQALGSLAARARSRASLETKPSGERRLDRMGDKATRSSRWERNVDE